MYRTLWATLVTCLVLVPMTGCNDKPCPLGQVEVDGECVDLVGDASAICGAGTYYNSGEEACFPDPAEVCGPATEVEWILDENGVATNEFVCKGTGSDVQPPECEPAQPGGTVCVNGFIRYLMDPDDPSKVMTSLAQFETTTLKVVIYDPLQYAVDPSVAPLGENEVVIHADGTFRVENVEVPGTGFLAAVVDDDDTVGADNFVFTGFAYNADDFPEGNLENIDAYIVTAAQNTTWSEAIGVSNIQATDARCAASDSLYACGTWVGVYGYPEGNGYAFVEGVQPQTFPGPNILSASKAWYLDTDFETFIPGTTTNQTTATGMVFYPSASLGNYSGICASGTPCDTEGYTWDQQSGVTGGAAKDAIFVQLKEPLGFE